LTNARKSRENRKLEREKLAEQQWEEEKLQSMRENYQVFECSGSQQHSPDCDGGCDIVTLEGYDLEIAKEGQRWNELGLMAVGTLPQTPIPGVGVNTFHLEIALNALLEAVIEKGLATKEELDESYAKAKLERMQEIRRINEPKIVEARQRARVGLPTEEPQIILPTERRTKFQ
jgi:hypothetical protein